MTEFRERLRALLVRSREDRALDDELRFHLDMAVEENLRRGMSPEEARRQAALRLGGAAQVREATREARGIRWLDDFGRDLRYAARALLRSPAFTLVAVCTLALGIGANSALFGLLDAFFDRQPPGVTGGDRVVWVENPAPADDASYADYLDLRDGAAALIDIAAYDDTHFALGAGGSAAGAAGAAGDALRVAGQLVSANYFDVLGARPVHGRGFRAEEGATVGAYPVAILGHDLWRRRFGGDSGVVGRSIVLNGQGFTVVGVAPPGFVGIELDHPAELWVPIAMQPVAMPVYYDYLRERATPLLRLVGRLREGVSAERASAALAVLAERLNALEPDRFRPLAFEVKPLEGWVTGGLGSERATVLFAWVLTALVLLIACANVANLLLARAVARGREIGVRIALGAGRGRLLRLLICESVLLSLIAGGAGAILAFWGAQSFQSRFRGTYAPLDVSPDADTLLFTLGVAVATGVAFGLVPSWRASRPGAASMLTREGPGVTRRSRLQSTLVVSQVALSVVLLFAAGLFVRKLQDTRAIDLGFDAEGVLVLSFDLHPLGYSEAAKRAFYDELRARVERLPGVRSAAVPAYVPLGGGAAFYGVRPVDGATAAEATDRAATRGRADAGDSGDRAGATGDPTGSGTAGAGRGTGEPVPGRPTAVPIVGVAPGYFRSLGIPLLRGRGFTDADLDADAAGVIVSADFARRFWPGADPVGRRFRLGGSDDAPVVQVVGVAGDIAVSQINAPTRSLVYRPYTRHFVLPRTDLVVRTIGDPAGAARMIRDEIRRMDPALPVFDVRTLAAVIDEKIGVERRLTAVISGIGAIALLLATLGLYGVVAYTAAGRTREIGVRMALGARPGAVVRLFLRDGMRLTAFGLAVGAVLASGLGWFVASLVYGVRPLDPATLLGVGCTLALAAGLASYLPARRAARTDPMVALRVE